MTGCSEGGPSPPESLLASPEGGSRSSITFVLATRRIVRPSATHVEIGDLGRRIWEERRLLGVGREP